MILEAMDFKGNVVVSFYLFTSTNPNTDIYPPLGYERVYLPLYKVTVTPFHIQGDDIYIHHFVSTLYQH